MFEQSDAGGSPEVEMPADAAAVERMSAARRRTAQDAFECLDAIADLIIERQHHEHYRARERWYIDGWSSIAAEVAAALGCGKKAASIQMTIAWNLRFRLPQVAAVFRAGLITAQVASMISWQTHLIEDRDIAAVVDAELASQCFGFGVLSEKKITAAIQDVINNVDPDAVRRQQDKARARDLQFGTPDDETGTVSVYGSMDQVQAAIFEARINQMAATVCSKDPRTLGQRRSDAPGALAAGKTRLDCLCGTEDCAVADQADEDTFAHLHLYALVDADLLDTPPDPLVHGGDEHDDENDEQDQDQDDEPWWTYRPEPAEPEPEPTETESQSEPAAAAESPVQESPPVPDRDAHSRAPQPEESAAPQPEPGDEEPAAAEGSTTPQPNTDPGESGDAARRKHPRTAACRQPRRDDPGEESARGTTQRPDTPAPEPDPPPDRPNDISEAEESPAPQPNSDPIEPAEPGVSGESARRKHPRTAQCRQPRPQDPGEESARSTAQLPQRPETPTPEPDPTPEPKRKRKRRRGPAAVILGGGRLTPAQVGDLVRGGATVHTLKSFRDAPAENHYRFSPALTAFIRSRDLTCRFPNCEVPAHRCDIDHTDPHPHGSTHASNGKCYCRPDHLLKTFWTGEKGWSDIQLPDGTVIVTTPSGHTYRTVPGSRRLFPHLPANTGPAPPGATNTDTPQPDSPHKGLKMPKRKATREQQRRYAIQTERERNRQRNAAEKDVTP